MQAACELLNKGLRDDFGFDHLLWVFSGRRGIHCWVCDPTAKNLKNEARQAVIEYLSMIANETSGSLIKPNLLRKRKHPAVERALITLEPYFVDIVLKD